MAGFPIYVSVTQRSPYGIMCHDRVPNISRVLNMPGLGIRQSARVTQGSKYATVWLNSLNRT